MVVEQAMAERARESRTAKTTTRDSKRHFKEKPKEILMRYPVMMAEEKNQLHLLPLLLLLLIIKVQVIMMVMMALWI